MPASDLMPSVRIRNVALRLFAERGFAATSVRDIAREAGISVGQLQHRYPAKDDVRRAVDDYVSQIFRAAYEDLPSAPTQDLIFEEFGDRITTTVRDHPTVVSYVVRTVADGDEAGTALVDGIVQIAVHQIRSLAQRGLVRPDLDNEWAALSIVIFSLSTIMFRTSIERLLGRSFLDDDVLQRWNSSSTILFQAGIANSSDRGPTP
ncbi:TetR/AcrR family transcriptional regulator [Mycobacterium sp. BMJ-28]